MISKDQLNSLYRYAYSLTHNEDAAFDLVHDNVEKYLKADNTRIEEPLHFIMRCIRNSFIDETRKNKLRLIKHEEIKDDRNIASPSLDEIIIKQSETEAILKTLSADDRELLYLSAVEEYTVQEISDFQKIPRGTLLSKLHRIKKMLKRKFSSEENHNQNTPPSKGESL
ncbi:MAG: sigma-70 family RNA polymerase sigma factor [Pseudomonadales bacterium]|nr:sigma-70 family RNA polymerase sigma factor [Pseudomonadales bacterium]